MDVPFAEVPTIYKNVIIVGANVYGPGETNLHPQDEVAAGVPGDSRAYDARTGKKLWDFHAIAQPGEVGHNTWGGDSWKGRGGTNVWSMAVTVDEKRGIVYMPFGGPAANYYGGDRPGDNLFSNTLVAADATTGKLKWYFQTVHHELWDFDLPPEPVLMDVMHDGKKVPALVQTGKIGYVFVFDRVTGKPVFPIEERPVPKGDAPGEQYSPTQPFPVKPPPVARVTISRDDIVSPDDTTPEHSKACHELWDKSNFYNAGPYTPWVVHSSPADTKLTLIFPGATGGANWGGAASDPTMGYVFVNMQNSGSTGFLEKNPKYNAQTEGTEVEYHRGTGSGSQYGGFSAPVKDANGKVIGNWPCQKPPWETLSAVNINTGEIAWTVPLGITEELPEAKQHTGRAGAFAGPIATAGGVVFIGATNDNRFRAFDSKTGKELWVHEARLHRNRRSHHISRQERKAVRRHHGRKRRPGQRSGPDGLRAAVDRQFVPPLRGHNLSPNPPKALARSADSLPIESRRSSCGIPPASENEGSRGPCEGPQGTPDLPSARTQLPVASESVRISWIAPRAQSASK